MFGGARLSAMVEVIQDFAKQTRSVQTDLMTQRRSGRPASSMRIPRPEVVPSAASTLAVRARMQRQRTRDTQPEIAVRRLLHAEGLRYRVDAAPLAALRRRADIVFSQAQVAVFIDGCFWHGCPVHSGLATSVNRGYWQEKIQRNQKRDRDTDEQLTASGWLAIRVWEHDDPVAVAAHVATVVRTRRMKRPSTRVQPSARKLQ
jgi:DNA mismatch endonuclease (patch repair protein)